VTPRAPAVVVVTDADQRGAVAALRSLKRAGHRTLGTSSVTPASGHWSRACDTRRHTPDPHEGAPFADAVREAVEALGAAPERALLLPTTDIALECLSLHRDRLGGMVTGFPAHQTVLACLDKRALLVAAAAAGLPGPRSHDCADAVAVHQALEELGPDVIVKPFRSEPLGAGARRTAVAPATPEEARREAMANLPVTIQERLPGSRLVMVGGVVRDGRLRCASVFEALRLWPAVTGSASAAVTIEPPDGLLDGVTAMLHGLGWQGPFNIDLLADHGQFRTIDLNPRLFAPLDIAIRSGADIPAVWCELLGGGDPAFTLGRPGVIYRWDEAELVNLGAALRHGRFRDAAAILRPHRASRAALFRVTDPGPLVARLIEAGRRRAA
jgi:hypothetical protein